MNTQEKAVEDYHQFFRALPHHVDALIANIHQRFATIDPVSSEAYAQAMHDTMADADRVFGIITAGDDRGSFAPYNAMIKAGVPKEQMEDVRRAWLHTRRTESDRYREAVSEAREVHKKRMQQQGKDMLENANGLTPEQTVMACFFKHGILVDRESGSVQKMLTAVEQKDLKTLVSWIGYNSQNPASQEAFSRLTGVSLGKTQKERVAQLEKWVGQERVQAIQREDAEQARVKAETLPFNADSAHDTTPRASDADRRPLSGHNG